MSEQPKRLYNHGIRLQPKDCNPAHGQTVSVLLIWTAYKQPNCLLDCSQNDLNPMSSFAPPVFQYVLQPFKQVINCKHSPSHCTRICSAFKSKPCVEGKGWLKNFTVFRKSMKNLKGLCDFLPNLLTCLWFTCYLFIDIFHKIERSHLWSPFRPRS